MGGGAYPPLAYDIIIAPHKFRPLYHDAFKSHASNPHLYKTHYSIDVHGPIM